jgi:hypothetical protein
MYRVYFRDGANRRITDFHPIQAESDSEAMAAFLALRDGFRRLELWAGERLVATLPASDEKRD